MDGGSAIRPDSLTAAITGKPRPSMFAPAAPAVSALSVTTLKAEAAESLTSAATTAICSPGTNPASRTWVVLPCERASTSGANGPVTRTFSVKSGSDNTHMPG